jgi:hypothetical protein
MAAWPVRSSVVLVGALAGGSAGIALGEVVDNKILDNYQCLCCQFTFSPSDEPIQTPFDL